MDLDERESTTLSRESQVLKSEPDAFLIGIETCHRETTSHGEAMSFCTYQPLFIPERSPEFDR